MGEYYDEIEIKMSSFLIMREITEITACLLAEVDTAGVLCIGSAWFSQSIIHSNHNIPRKEDFKDSYEYLAFRIVTFI